MIKVMILEDKPIIMQNIRQKVKNFDDDIEIIGTAFNGIEGLKIIDEQVPDIIITDIRMPVMDGLEFIKKVRTISRKPKYVIISGHDEFEYARTAMKLGVHEYLLKPIDQQKLNKTLEKLADEITTESTIEVRSTLQNILNGQKDYYGVLEGIQYFYTILICDGSYTNYNADYAHPNNFLISESDITDYLRYELPEGVDMAVLQSGKLNELFCIFLLKDRVSIAIESISRLLYQKLSVRPIPTTILFSNRLASSDLLFNASRTLHQILRTDLIYSNSQIIGLKKTIEPEEDDQVISEIEQSIILAFKTNKLSILSKKLDDFLIYCGDKRYTQTHLETHIKNIISQLTVGDMTINDTDYFTYIEELLAYNPTYEALRVHFQFFFKQLHESLHKPQKRPIDDIVEDVSAYIDKYYANQLSINDIALMFNIDASYLSKCFKATTGKAPMTYLTEVRINCSKQLLSMDRQMKLRDIAEAVGYSNQYYFSRIFKSVTGQTPSQYREETH